MPALDVWIKAKRVAFRRGYLPQSDYHELMERIERRKDEIFTKSLQMDSTELRSQSYERFLRIFSEEGEKQWDKIIDRRVAAWFYSCILNFSLGIIAGILLSRLL